MTQLMWHKYSQVFPFIESHTSKSITLVHPSHCNEYRYNISHHIKKSMKDKDASTVLKQF